MDTVTSVVSETVNAILTLSPIRVNCGVLEKVAACVTEKRNAENNERVFM
jgi:hypothetical protein